MSDLNWNLREILYVFKDSRLPVFTSIFLHKNTRNRSWPSNELIATETGLSSAPISSAIGWLIECHVVVLVPYDKRVGLELKLPNRKNIYQLTGVVLVDGQYWPYMNLTPEGWFSIADDLEDMGNSLLSKQLNEADSLLSKCLDSKRLESKRKGIKELDSEVPKKKTKGSKEKIAPSGAGDDKPPRPPNPIFDAVAIGFGMDAAEIKTAGGRIGKIASWLQMKNDGGGMGFISAPATVANVEDFFKDWSKKKIDAPRDLVKFIEQWRTWAKSKKSTSGIQKGSKTGIQWGGKR